MVLVRNVFTPHVSQGGDEKIVVDIKTALCSFVFVCAVNFYRQLTLKPSKRREMVKSKLGKRWVWFSIINLILLSPRYNK